MRQRDHDYIENRLLAPCVPVLEAAERLTKIGEGEAAIKLMRAVVEFNDVCRAVRTELKSH